MPAKKTLTALVAVVAALAAAASAAAGPSLPLDHAGRWITDADGRVFLPRGFNMVFKLAPYTPEAIGFGDDDARFLAAEGFDAVRVGVILKALEPRPGVYDDAYLGRIEATVDTLARHGIVAMIDFHQDLFNERFQGEGWPDWAVVDDGLPAQPQAGFPNNYLVMPALQRAFDHFWANDPSPADPAGIGLQDRYAAAWAHVAARFEGKPSVLGYELLNEPWPGTLWQLCANPVGCPLFDAALAGFNRRVTATIRAVDPKTLIWVEPNVLFNQGVNTTLPALGDPHAGFAFHDYCLPAGFTGTYDPGCDATDQIVFANAVAHVQGTGEALLMTEFGATDRREDLDGVMDKADRSMVPWIEWHYCGCKDPTTAGPGDKQAVVIDPAKAPEGDNIKRSTLDLLARPHPAVIAGTPAGWSWTAAARRLEVAWSTQRARPGTGAFGDEDVSEISVTPRAMPDGYAAMVDGGAVISAPGARVLQVAACPGARRVSVTVTPGGPARSSCDPGTVGPRLSVSVRPRTLRAGRATRLRIKVRAKGRALPGARVRVAGARTTTDRRGAATLRVRYARAGRVQLLVAATGHRLARVALRVRR